MFKPIFLLITLTLLRVQQDVKVLTYSTGKVESDGYESLSFWIKDNKRAYIRYAHGMQTEDMELLWAGVDSAGGRKGCVIRFPAPDTVSWVLLPEGDGLNVSDRWGKYRKDFRWENENGETADSVCSICARDEKEAMRLLKKYFFK